MELECPICGLKLVSCPGNIIFLNCDLEYTEIAVKCSCGKYIKIIYENPMIVNIF